MPREHYPEHDIMGDHPVDIEICHRCKRGQVYYLGGVNDVRPYCIICGNDEPGEKYKRVREA